MVNAAPATQIPDHHVKIVVAPAATVPHTNDPIDLPTSSRLPSSHAFLKSSIPSQNFSKKLSLTILSTSPLAKFSLMPGIKGLSIYFFSFNNFLPSGVCKSKVT